MNHKVVSTEELAHTIQTQAQPSTPFVIAVSGFGGAGKSTTTEKLSNLLGNTTIIHLDDFIINRLSEHSSDWVGFDWDRLITQILQPIKDGKKEIEYEVYDWKQNTLIKKVRVTLTQYVIVEGVGLIRDNLKPYFNCSAWINTPFEVAMERGRKRDKEEYGVDHDKLWAELWGPNDKDYFEKYQPDKKADYILNV